MSDEKPEQAELALREFLRQRLENAASPRGVHLSREELSQWAASRDDTTAEDAVSLFERWEGTVWFGERVEGEHFGWNTAWIIEVRQRKKRPEPQRGSQDSGPALLSDVGSNDLQYQLDHQVVEA